MCRLESLTAGRLRVETNILQLKPISISSSFLLGKKSRVESDWKKNLVVIDFNSLYRFLSSPFLAKHKTLPNLYLFI